MLYDKKMPSLADKIQLEAKEAEKKEKKEVNKKVVPQKEKKGKKYGKKK